MHVLHCITGLSGDGAQRVLLRLIDGLQQRGYQSSVVTLGAHGGIAYSFDELGVPVYALGLTPSVHGISQLFAFRRLLEQLKPTLAQGWMYHANSVLSVVARGASHQVPVLWNIRRGLDDLTERKLSTRAFVKASALCSSWAKKIIYCTEISRLQHEAYGFVSDASLVIDNGYNPEVYYRSNERRERWRKALAISDRDFVIGCVGRYDPAKGHAYLIDAFELVARGADSAKLVLVGRGADPNNTALMSRLEQAGLVDRVLTLGESREAYEIYSAFDLMCSSSVAEGFPNVVAEAMLSELPCVVTDTGASRELVEGVGTVVPSRSSQALTEAILEFMHRPEGELRQVGCDGRQRIINRYSLGRIVQQYDELYRGMVRS